MTSLKGPLRTLACQMNQCLSLARSTVTANVPSVHPLERFTRRVTVYSPLLLLKYIIAMTETVKMVPVDIQHTTRPDKPASGGQSIGQIYNRMFSEIVCKSSSQTESGRVVS